MRERRSAAGEAIAPKLQGEAIAIMQRGALPGPLGTACRETRLAKSHGVSNAALIVIDPLAHSCFDMGVSGPCTTCASISCCW